MTRQRWYSLSRFAGRPVKTKRDASAILRRFIIQTGHPATAQQSKGNWYAVWRDNRGPRTNLSRFYDDYAADLKPRSVHKYWHNSLTSLRKFNGWAYNHSNIRDLGDVTRRHIDEWIRSLPDTISATTKRRHIEAVRAALNKAVEWDLITSNPVLRVKMPPARDTRETRVLTDTEISIVRQFPIPLRQWCALCLDAGLRRAEATYAAWSDFDFDGLTLRITAKPDVGFSPKGTRYRDGAADIIPIPARLVDILSEIDRSGRFVFDGGNSQPLMRPNSWARFLTRETTAAGIPHVTSKMLRHTFVTRLVLSGVTPAVVQFMARHRDAATTARYTHVSLADAAREIARVSNSGA